MRTGDVILGTAAFGMKYGVSNPFDAVSHSATESILDAAWDAGIRSVDTAPAYGDAELRLGRWMKTRQRRLVVISKLPALGARPLETAISVLVRQSCKNLCVDCIDGYLVHRARDLQKPVVADSLQALSEKGLIGAFGASVYTDREAEEALSVPGLKLLQVPINLLSQQMIDSGILAQCQKAGIMVFARSIFLQGTFFMKPNRLPEPLQSYRQAFYEIQTIAKDAGCELGALAFAFVRDLPGVSSSVIGIYDIVQLRSLIANRDVPALSPDILARIRLLAQSVPYAAVDPRNW